MTITEKILAEHAGKRQVTPGDNVWADIDMLLTHDVCGPGTIGIFREYFGRAARVWDPHKVIIIPDHYIFTADERSQRNVLLVREFAYRQGIRSYYDPDFVTGRGMPEPYADPNITSYRGVCHVVMAEERHTLPGQLLVGTDSHTCTAGAFGQFATGIGNTEAGFVMGTGKLWLKVPPTMRFVFDGPLPPYLMAKDLILTVIGQIGVDGATYRAMEFAGSGVEQLEMYERMTLCNMAIEAGAKTGIIAADNVTESYINSRHQKPYEILANDPDASFISEHTYETSGLEPVVAKPHSPANCASARELAGTKLDRAYIGSCTGGKLPDFLAAARILKGRECKIETFIVPATTAIDANLNRHHVDGMTIREVFEKAGARIGPASCAACLGGPPDTFGRANTGVRVISSTNRNFPGRMGSKDAEVFLASPLTVAASAVTGEVTDPRQFLEG
jgi:3-isopropylmalate/(R)-2-methylmalate dehydratase large subunit